MRQVIVRKLDHTGREVFAYPARVVARAPQAIVLSARWDRPPMKLEYVCLETGDRWLETFYADRWYNVFVVRAADGSLKGWYANVTHPARLDAEHLEWDDLLLDVWMNARGETLVLDEEEFDALAPKLMPIEVASARGALAQLVGDLRARWREYANDVIAAHLQTLGWTLATAESCTGGLIGDWITNRPGSSAYFVGGIIAYSNAIKHRLLGVRVETLEREGAVSATCALEMARGAREKFGATLGLAITGIAGPGGGTPEKPVGLVYLALADARTVIVERHIWCGNRVQNKEQSAQAALELLHRYLSNR